MSIGYLVSISATFCPANAPKGPYLHSISLNDIATCKRECPSDSKVFCNECTRRLVDFQELHVEFEGPSARVTREARAAASSDALVIKNATLLTMHHGVFEKDYIKSGSLLVQNGVFKAVGQVDIPEGAHVIDAQGGEIM